jgi:hypothetical protein
VDNTATPVTFWTGSNHGASKDIVAGFNPCRSCRSCTL